MKTLVVGLDGFCRPVLDTLTKNNVVPTLEELSNRAAVGTLTSQLPPWTPSAWPSMYTGVNPGKHGVFDFLHFDGYDWELVDRSCVNEHAIWELLSTHGYSSVVVNVPVTAPPSPFDGALIPGYLASEHPPTHPTGLLDELEAELGAYSLYGTLLDETVRGERRVNELVRLTRMRGAAFRYLCNQFDPDFGFVQFQSTDTVFHEFPDSSQVVQSVFRAVDEEVASIFEMCEPDLTLLVSDHGIGPMCGYEFRVNNFLHEAGYVEKTADGAGMPTWKTTVRDQLERPRPRAIAKSTAIGGMKGLAKLGMTSQRIGAILSRVGLEDRVLNAVPIDVVRAGTEQVDFPASTAYMRSRTEMGVRMNVAGREPGGIIDPAEYDRVRSELIDLLRSVDTPDGRPVFERVYPREVMFDGDFVEHAPDIITVPERFDHFLVSTLKGDLFGEPTEPWEHKEHGIVVAMGEDVDPGTDLHNAHLLDIAPTIIASFGIPIPERLDGRALPIVESTDRASTPPFDHDESDRSNDSAVIDRLAQLGYLE